MAVVRWGFLGCGRISNDFVTAMKNLPHVQLQACAARSLEGAQAFADKFGIARAYGSYEELCADPAVDVIYIGTQHIVHFENTKLALSHGKHVIVEKPMMMNANQVEAVVALARENNCLLVEAIWTRFFPAMQFVRELLAQQRIGDVKNLHADMGVAFPSAVKSVWSRAMGGGGLNCIGLYPLSFATLVFGTEPVKVTAVGGLSSDGVDTFAAITLEYADQRFATVEYTMLSNMEASVQIVGTTGRIEIHNPAYAPTEVTVTEFVPGGKDEVATKSVFPKPLRPTDAGFNYSRSEGLAYEAEAVTKAVLDKQTEMAEYPLDEAVGLARLMQKIRRQVGVVYDSD